MCLAVPGKVVRWIEEEGPFAKAEVEFDGVRRECQMAFLKGASIGDYVLVHAGVAISVIDAEEASRVLDGLASLTLDDDHLDA